MRDIPARRRHPVAESSDQGGSHMIKAYRILATIIAVDVVIQAMAIVFAVAGLTIWVSDGGN